MFDVIIAANGISSRMGFDKLSAGIGTKTVIDRTVNAFRDIPEIDKIILVSNVAYDISGVVCVKGGSTRQESVKLGLEAVTSDYVLIHDGARPFVSRDLIISVMNTAKEKGCAVPCIPSSDSIRTVKDGKIIGGIDRATSFLVQTPQGFNSNSIKYAFEKAELSGKSYTDESEMYSKFIAPCHTVTGENANRKLTTPADFFGLNARIGTGYDVHRRQDGKKLKLCGLEIPCEFGLLAHSDGDVCLHAVMDALLTAVGERDIGVFFPDVDERYKDADSAELLKTVLKILNDKNAEIISLNLTVIAQKPKLSNHIEKMRSNLSALLNIDSQKISISATTSENLGIIADGNAIAAIAAAVVI